MNYFFTVVP
jgi:hypothetical protein